MRKETFFDLNKKSFALSFFLTGLCFALIISLFFVDAKTRIHSEGGTSFAISIKNHSTIEVTTFGKQTDISLSPLNFTFRLYESAAIFYFSEQIQVFDAFCAIFNKNYNSG